MARNKRIGLTAQKWHESLERMRPAYDELVKICIAHKPSSPPYQVASSLIQSLNDLADKQGRTNHYYFRSEPHSTHNNTRHDSAA
jgi:hypothetical protein|tara:strand:+ start:957 stop:1211 length:255 start_codon:yes stop_codon:yes gene_type:complete